jgi:hypothetical protein
MFPWPTGIPGTLAWWLLYVLVVLNLLHVL